MDICLQAGLPGDRVAHRLSGCTQTVESSLSQRTSHLCERQDVTQDSYRRRLHRRQLPLCALVKTRQLPVLFKTGYSSGKLPLCCGQETTTCVNLTRQQLPGYWTQATQGTATFELWTGAELHPGQQHHQHGLALGEGGWAPGQVCAAWRCPPRLSQQGQGQTGCWRGCLHRTLQAALTLLPKQAMAEVQRGSTGALQIS